MGARRAVCAFASGRGSRPFGPLAIATPRPRAFPQRSAGCSAVPRARLGVAGCPRSRTIHSAGLRRGLCSSRSPFVRRVRIRHRNDHAVNLQLEITTAAGLGPNSLRARPGVAFPIVGPPAKAVRTTSRESMTPAVLRLQPWQGRGDRWHGDLAVSGAFRAVSVLAAHVARFAQNFTSRCRTRIRRALLAPQSSAPRRASRQVCGGLTPRNCHPPRAPCPPRRCSP